MIRYTLLIVSVCILAHVYADTLVLKTGQRYTGTVTAPSPGRFAIRTDIGVLEFSEDVVAVPQLRIDPPRNATRVQELIEGQRFEEALPLAEQWLERYRYLPTVWYERALYFTGLSQSMTGQEDAAVQTFQTLLDTFPDSTFNNEVRARLIDLQIAGKDGDELERTLRNLIEDRTTPRRTRALTHRNLGRFYERNGDLREALEHYVAVIVLYGDIDEGDLQEATQYRVGELFLREARTNEAVFYFTQVQQVYPDGQFAEAAGSHLSSLTQQTGE